MKKLEIKKDIKKRSRYGRLIILEEIEGKRTPKGVMIPRVKCICDCGRITNVYLWDLRSGKTQSCGCLGLENSLKNIIKASKANIKHMMSGSKTYQVWTHMIGRCTNPKDRAYKYYGARGIKVCKRWLDSFENFFDDMGESPLNLSLDRIDNNGDYCKNNCRWATKKEQAMNRRNTKFFTHNGKTLCMSDWSKELGGSKSLISFRINKLGWSLQKAVFTPVFPV